MVGPETTSMELLLAPGESELKMVGAIIILASGRLGVAILPPGSRWMCGCDFWWARRGPEEGPEGVVGGSDAPEGDFVGVDGTVSL